MPQHTGLSISVSVSEQCRWWTIAVCRLSQCSTGYGQPEGRVIRQALHRRARTSSQRRHSHTQQAGFW